MTRHARLTRPTLCVSALASILAACADEEPTLTSPPDPQFATGEAAQQLVVTTIEDTEECDPSGECSLRGAVEFANADPEGGPYTIVLEAGETYTLTETGALDVRVGLVIEGNGATIAQDDADIFNSVIDVGIGEPPGLALNDVTVTGASANSGIRVFGSALTLAHSTVSNNYNSADIGDGFGGGIQATGGTITLIDSRVIDNTAEGTESSSRDGRGGGIYSVAGEVTLRNSVVSGNRVLGLGEAAAYGGGIYSEGGQLTLIHSTVSDNVAEISDNVAEEENGGGIWAGDSDLVLTNSVVSGNIATFGGGVFLSSGTLTVERTTLSDNFAAIGGAIHQSGGTLTAVNTTLSGNVGPGGGGAINNEGGDLALINGTVTGNTSGLFVILGGAISGAATLTNTIVADQERGSDCLFASITSLGHNLDSDGSCGLTGPSDQPNANANLGPLAANGGPTRTHELLEGSDALDGGDDAVCAADPVNGVDQRGIERAQGPACDIGAFELEVEPIATVLTAEPALLELGGLLGLRIRLLDLSARLVRADSGDPIAGETIAMTVAGPGGGSQEVCSAVTDDDGVGTCSGGLGSLLGLVLSGYTATFTGTWQYEPSSADAPLIRVDVGG